MNEAAYERVFQIGKTIGFLKVSHCPDESKINLQVVTDDPTILFTVSQKVRQMFDLDSDPLLVANSFQSHKTLDALCKKYPGLRIARGWDPFETAICTILGQLVSVTQARNLIGQLVKHYGRKVTHPVNGNEAYLFPTPEALMQASLAEVKTTEKRKQSIREFSRLVVEGGIDLLTPQDPEKFRKRLLGIPGIGPWSAEYISLRALGDADSFPGTDLILKRAMEKHDDLNLENIRPWRSYAAIYLWKHYAESLSKQKKAPK